MHIKDRPINEARKSDAIALFDGKYGTEVRVVITGDGFDKELCDSTHVASTSCIGRAALLDEISIGLGVCRVGALVGEGTYSSQAGEHALVTQISAPLRGRPEEPSARVETLLVHVKESEKGPDKIRIKQALAQAITLAQAHESLNGIALVVKDTGGLPSTDTLRDLTVEVRDQMGEAPTVVALIARVSSKPSIVIIANRHVRDTKIKAGKIVGATGFYLGGGGGGCDGIAQGDDTRLSVIAEALGMIRREATDS